MRTSLFDKIRSNRAFSTFKILPRRGSIAWKCLSRPDFADPPAESPSTINNSLISASFEEQSDNFPGKFDISNALLRLVNSRAFRAATLAREAIIPFSTITRATDGFSNKYFEKASLNTESVTERASLFPNFVFVCPSNCGSVCLMETITVMPSRTRSEEHTSELQSRGHLVCRLLLEKKKQSKVRKRERE